MLHGETVTADDFQTFQRHFPRDQHIGSYAFIV